MKVTISLSGEGIDWTARAYHDETDQHIWSSENAPSISQALTEIGTEVWTFEREVVSSRSMS